MRYVLRLTSILALVSVFVLSGVLHNTVHHEHGHGPGDSAIWHDLHAAIKHDDKKVISLPVLFCILLLSLIALQPLLTARNRIHVMFLQPDKGALLRRGIHPYRRFA